MSNTNNFTTFNRLRSEKDQNMESTWKESRHISAHRNGIDVDITISWNESITDSQAEDIIRTVTKL